MENSEWNERRDPKGSAENEEQMQTGQDLSGDAAEAPGQERTEVTEDTEMVVEETAENLSAGQELQPETESGAGSQPAQDQAGVMPEIPGRRRKADPAGSRVRIPESRGSPDRVLFPRIRMQPAKRKVRATAKPRRRKSGGHLPILPRR